MNVLEIGAGSCNCGIALARKGAKVTCSDISQEQLKIGQQVGKKAGVNISFVCTSMTDLSIEVRIRYPSVLVVDAMKHNCM